MRSLVLFLLAGASLAANAQSGFTRLALTDTLFADERRTDFFVSTALPGDTDGDGDVDLMILGTWVRYGPRPVDGIVAFENVFRVFLNDGPVGDTAWAFSRGPEIPIGSARTGRSAAAWGDYDNDGDLDLAFAPESNSATCCFRGALRLFRNDGAAFVRDSIPNLNAWDYGASQLDVRTVSWADTDNDGDLDLLLPGVAEYSGTSFMTTAVVLRNDGPDANGAWTWTRTEPGLPGRTGAASVWADMDADGDLDVLLGTPVDDGAGGFVLRTWQNDGGQFTPAGPMLPAYWGGTVDWSDMDGDSDLDVLVSGRSEANPSGAPERAVVYVNQGDHYDETVVLATGTVPQPVGQDRWFDVFGSAWADYDSDGDLDVLAAGSGIHDGPGGFPHTHFGRAIVFRNDGGAFVPADTLASLYGDSAGENQGAFAWFDVDGDGDLDHFAAGRAYDEDFQYPYGNVKTITYLYRNDAPGGNAAPSAPAGLAATATADGAALVWTPATDDRTAAPILTYNLRVSTLDGQDIVSPHARPGNGGRLLPEPGNVSHDLHWALRGLTAGTYTWAVQAVDNAFNAGPFADGGTFTVGTVDAAAGPSEPAVLALAPNPSAGATRVTLVLPASGRVTLEVLDALGRRVALLSQRDLAAGAHAWPLDGARLAPGVYAVRAQVEAPGGPTEVLVGRLTVVR